MTRQSIVLVFVFLTCAVLVNASTEKDNIRKQPISESGLMVKSCIDETKKSVLEQKSADNACQFSDAKLDRTISIMNCTSTIMGVITALFGLVLAAMALVMRIPLNTAGDSASMSA